MRDIQKFNLFQHRLKKIDSCFQVKIVLDMSSYVKLTAFSIKIIFRSLTLFVLQILAVY